VNPKVNLSEFVAGFLAESDDLLSIANTTLMAIEAAARTGKGSPRSVREAYRALHTIKGLSSMVGVEPIVALAHQMEALLRRADQGAQLDAEALDVLLQGVRAIELRVRALREGKAVPAAPAGLLQKLEQLDTGPAGAAGASKAQVDLEPELSAKLAAMDRDQLTQGLAAGKSALRAEFMPTPAKAAQGVTITSVREQLKNAVEIVKVLPRSVPASEGAPAGLSFVLVVLTDKTLEAVQAVMPLAGLQVTLLAAPQPEAAPDLIDFEAEEPELGGGNGLVRVEVARLDDTMEKLSALIVTRFRLARAVAEMAASGVDVRTLSQIMAENARQLRDLRAAVLQVRMVRVADALDRVPLLVRGLRRNTGKQVRLEMDLGTAEVDKAVADRLFPAVVHLVRNAVDHAIETPQERKALGKPEEGLLRIVCVSRGGNQLELAIEDDGRGVDREKLARRANAPVPQTDEALLDLLCQPGLSTRDVASTTSGRGMGMDIVRGVAVGQLGGELTMQTRPGHGTTFTLRVPLSITIVDAFTFECAGERFVTPVSSVEEIVEINPATLTHGPGQGVRATMMQRRGQALQILQLSSVFHLREAAPGTRALVVRRGGEATGIAVHKMLGQQEVVVRPMDDALVRVTGVSGATDLGDGKPTLVLDLVALAAAALGLEALA
jgi:two-component system, chemotaxis family, sensor kinase CheA